MSQPKVNNIKEALSLIELDNKDLIGAAFVLTRVAPVELKVFATNVPAGEAPKNTDRLLDAKKCWDEYLNSRKKPSPFDLRYICWLPQISTSDLFLKFLSNEKVILRNRELRGLLFGVLTNYRLLKDNNSTRKLISDVFSRAPEQLQKMWQEIELYLLKTEGLGVSALEILRGCVTPREYLQKKYNLTVETGDVYQALLNKMCEFGKEMLLPREAEKRKWAYERVLPNCEASEKFLALEKAIFSFDEKTDATAKQDLKKFLLEDPFLGDPRLASGNWIRASDQLKEKIIQWLSSEDIRFFFESIFQVHLDTQGRKSFWMGYASLVKRTRVLLCEGDRRRCQSILTREGYDHSPVLGRLEDYGRQVSGSVFLMDFGDVIVAEYSVPNNSCWVFERSKDREIGPNFWKNSFRVSEIRNANESWRHASSWESKFATKLARFGIRPRGWYG